MEAATAGGTAAEWLGLGLTERLGQILMRQSRLAAEQVELAVREGLAAQERVGETLLRYGLIYPDELARALAEQHGLRHMTLDRHTVERSANAILPEPVVRELEAVPLRKAGKRVWIAISDPTDVEKADELRMLLPDCSLEFVVSDPASIRWAIDTMYGIAGVHEFHPRQSGDELAVAQPEPEVDEADEADGAPAVEIVNAILRRALELRASDLHFVPRRDDVLVRARVDGVMRELDAIGSEYLAPVIVRLKVLGGLDISERRLPQDGRISFTLDGVAVDLRIAVLPAALGESVAIRLLYLQEVEGMRALGDVGLDEETATTLRSALKCTSGAVIVAGPTGSGKTSTLYSAIRELHDGTRSIVTIEDPVEHAIPGIVQVEVNSRAGLTFGRGLRTILRADPDVILVGEIRDAETAAIAFQAAMTGHLVLSTLHADSTAGALVRLREMGIEPALLGSGLRCVVSQRLFRRPCRECGGHERGDARAVRACESCGGTGFRGRAAAFESLNVDDEVRSALAGTQADIAAASRLSGRALLRDNAAALVREGATTATEAARVCGEG